MKFRTIRLEEGPRDSVLLRLYNPPFNVISKEMIGELHHALNVVESSEKIGELVIAGGARGIFSFGADLKHELLPIALSEPESAMEAGYYFSRRGQELVGRLKNFSKPVTALIDGYALGGGLELALACRRIRATHRSIVGLPELARGIIPGFAGMPLLARRVGRMRCEELVTDARLVSAREAASYNIIDELVGEAAEPSPPKPDYVSPSMRMLVEQCASTLWSVPEEFLGLVLQVDARLFGLACSHPDAREGINAYVERRKNPRFLPRPDWSIVSPF